MRRYWLFPLVPLYDAATFIRNRLFDRGVLKSMLFDTPTIVLGNLNAGGSGKTPHIEYLLRLLSDKKCAVISRGYGRKTKGYLDVNEEAKALEVGDEPLQVKRKFQAVSVSVCEDRVMAVPQLLEENPETELILFDDAFQHRYLKGKINLLITSYKDPFYADCLLPFGNLRERRKESGRADFIIVSKCPPDLNKKERHAVLSQIRKYSSAPVFYTVFEYEPWVAVNQTAEDRIKSQDLATQPVFVFSAIAHGSAWAEEVLKRFSAKVGELTFKDHHAFSKHDINLFLKKWQQAGKPLVLTTEKDWMRLKEFSELLQEVPMLYFPLRVRMLAEEDRFTALLRLRLFDDSIE